MKEFYSNRKVDELGRVVLPIELRKALSLETGDSVAITLMDDSETVSMHKCRPSCSCCQGAKNLKRLPNSTYLCEDCLQNLS